MEKTKFLAIISLIFLMVIIHVIPVDATSEVDNLQDNFGKQTHLECMLSIPSSGEITFVERKFAVKACSLERPDPYVANTDEIIDVAEKILRFCEYAHPIYLLTNEIQFQVVMKWPHTRTCILLYDTPLWDYAGPDRAKALLNYLHDQRIQHLEETQDEREKSKVDARLQHGRIVFIVDLFQKQNEKIEFLEKQLGKKTELIVKNELLIQERQEMTENLNQSIKKISPLSADFPSLLVNEKLLECIKNFDLKSLSINEKLKVLQDCTKIDSHKLIVINDEKITSATEFILSYCQDRYPIYLEFGESTFYTSVQHQFVDECLWIYQQPLWRYQGPDRIEVLIEAGKPIVEQYLNKKIEERQKSVYEAQQTKGRFMIMTDFYNFGEQKISDLENQISEKNELISQQQIILEQILKRQNLNSEDLMVSDILQECIRDNGCVINRLTSLSISEPQYVVISVLNGVVSEWEKEQVTCHEISHHLGVFLYKYFDGDVSEALSHVDSKCGNSLYHGVIEFSLIDQMNSKNIDRDDVDITSTCKNVGSSTATNLHIQCVHGLGHAIAKLYENDVFEGIKRCDELEILEDQDMCYDGLLMENNNEDYFTGGGDYDENDIYYPCSALDEKYKKNCYFYQGYHILRENEESYEPSFEQCINMPDKNFIGKCIGAISQEMTYNQFYNNLDETVKMCNTVDVKYQIDCILSSLDALTLYIDEDLGYEFCQMVRADQKDECINRWESLRTFVKTT